MLKICAECNKEFPTERVNKLTCSDKCNVSRRRALRKEYIAKNLEKTKEQAKKAYETYKAKEGYKEKQQEYRKKWAEENKEKIDLQRKRYSDKRKNLEN